MAADADVYYQSPAGVFTGITAWFCRMTGRKFIFRVASDSDCEKEHGRIRLWRDRRLYDYGLKHADLVAAQTAGAGADAARQPRARSPVSSTCWSSRRGAPRRRSKRTSTFSGCRNLRTLKRPELVLELARQLPQVNFTLAGGAMPHPAGRTYFDDVQAAAARLPNVTMPGAVRYTDSGQWFDRAQHFPQHLQHRGISQHLPAGVDPRRAGGELLRSGRIDSPPAARCVSLPPSTTCAKSIRGLLETDIYRESIGRRARDFAVARIHQRGGCPLSRSARHKPLRVRVGAADGGTVP